MNEVLIFSTLGNHNLRAGCNLLLRLTERMREAREKHPVFAEGKYEAVGVVAAEMRELEHAVEHESDERMADEALDVIVTAIRLINGEHEGEASCGKK